MRILFSLLAISIVSISFAQERIDGSMPFQNDPAKKYSIYIPSSYSSDQPAELMVGLHPLNTTRWDAESWCDTLIQFCETNQLLLICPDGGTDGKIDDAIDTAFTTVIIDSMLQWYNVDQQKIWALGFSWGGKTTYTYGLNHVERFAGFMPIGAAINGTAEISGVLANAKDKPFYLVHGDLDAPNTRFTPLRDALIAEDACVEWNLLSNVDHTIDFPNRNNILTAAMTWLRDQNCGVSALTKTSSKAPVTISPNPSNGNVMLSNLDQYQKLEIWNLAGQPIEMRNIQSNNLEIQIHEKGIFLLHLIQGEQRVVRKILVY